MKKVDAIFVADLHIREDIPQCRNANFIEEQWKCLDYISHLQKKYDCPVLCSGDMFDYWKPSPWLLSKTIEHLPKQFYTVYGNHDLPNHSIELYEKCGIYTLLKAGKLSTLPQGNWGTIPNTEDALIIANRKILVWHKYTWDGIKMPWPGIKEKPAVSLIRKTPGFDVILTGDNHQTFVKKYKGTLLVNPGSMTRQDADQQNFSPRVYLWNARINKVRAVKLPKIGNVSRIHIEREQKKEQRIDAYISQLDNGWDVSINFPKNMEIFLDKNKVKKQVREIIVNAMDYE